MRFDVVSPYLDFVPGLRFFAVLFSDALILRSHLPQDGSHVYLRTGLHLHIYRVGCHLATPGCQLLQASKMVEG